MHHTANRTRYDVIILFLDNDWQFAAHSALFDSNCTGAPPFIRNGFYTNAIIIRINNAFRNRCAFMPCLSISASSPVCAVRICEVIVPQYNGCKFGGWEKVRIMRIVFGTLNNVLVIFCNNQLCFSTAKAFSQFTGHPYYPTFPSFSQPRRPSSHLRSAA